MPRAAAYSEIAKVVFTPAQTNVIVTGLIRDMEGAEMLGWSTRLLARGLAGMIVAAHESDR
jgi:hypothetical protein